MIKTIETTLTSQHDGLKLGLTLFLPDQPRGLLQIVHGMAEHRRRYYDFMQYCAEHGYAVIIHDHRGHGDSVANSQDFGFFGRHGADGMIDDAHQVTLYFKNMYPQLPLILLGHSMGSMVVRCYMKKYDQSVDGLVVCGSPSKNLTARAGLAVARLMKLWRGGHYRSPFLHHQLNDPFAKRFADEASPNSWVASDPAVVEAYDADEKNGFIFTLNGFETLFTLMLRTYSKRGWSRRHLDAPIFFIAGADDPCIVSEADFNKAVNFMRKIGYHDVRSKLYPGMRHEILNDRDKLQVYQDVLTWSEQKVL